MMPMCSYCYKLSKIVVNDDEFAEVCRKCDRGYKYTMEQVEEGGVGEDICRDCVNMRRMMRGMNFSMDELKMMMKKFHFYIQKNII